MDKAVWGKVFWIVVLTLSAGALGGTLIAQEFATEINKAMLLAAMSLLIGYITGLFTFAALFGNKGKVGQ